MFYFNCPTSATVNRLDNTVANDSNTFLKLRIILFGAVGIEAIGFAAIGLHGNRIDHN
jgi:hypothetical protein